MTNISQTLYVLALLTKNLFQMLMLISILNQALGGKPIVSLKARTKAASSWEKEHPGVLLNKRIERVLSHGKHLVGLIEGGYYFHSHLMMWGSWAVLDNPPQEIDRRERSRIVVLWN
ncbi:DNA-formamidopyrimidine glycosylase family protein [Coleofasciculus sp. G2-EDA-02]|uniref:DNA-formamidopyrimidine glycosylase family protein n=1 Tax=Coleofasciculus sp. G2-EDA-02 TaxID=3069529 RepID=UPI003303A05A